MKTDSQLLRSSVLVLNRSYLPIHVTNVKRACVLLYQGYAEVVDQQYRTYTFEEWSKEGASNERIGLVGRTMAVPRVIILKSFNQVPRRHVRFSRANVYLRDDYTCQYCGKMLPRWELNLDHVIPKTQGGGSTWDNVVCSCHRCNRRKGGRTPEQANVKLKGKPSRLQWTTYLNKRYVSMRYPEWKPFLTS